jgi:hypothetical protein
MIGWPNVARKTRTAQVAPTNVPKQTGRMVPVIKSDATPDAHADAEPDSDYAVSRRFLQLHISYAGQRVKGRLIGSGQRVQIPLRGDNAGVAEAFLYYLDVRAAGQQPGSVRVPEVVDPGTVEASLLAGRIPDLAAEPVGRDVPVGFPGPG